MSKPKIFREHISHRWVLIYEHRVFRYESWARAMRALSRLVWAAK